MSKRWKRAGLVLGSLALLLALVDVALARWFIEGDQFRGRPLPPFRAVATDAQRAWLARQQDELAGRAVPDPTGVFDSELGWTNRPSSRSADGRVSFNSVAARGTREYARQRPSGVRRIVAFGDSFTFGDEVADGDDWPAQLEAQGPAFEVMNFGVAGYGTDQALMRFRRDGKSREADVALLGMLIENIGRNVNRYRPLYYPSSGSCGAKPRFFLDQAALRPVPLPFAERAELVAAIADGSVIERLAEHEYWNDHRDLGLLGHSALGRIVCAFDAYSARQPKRLWRDPSGEPFRVTVAILDQFCREAKASGAETALVVLFPRQAELESLEADGEPYWTKLHEALRARSIDFVDVSEPLLAAWHPSDGSTPGGSTPGAIFQGGHLSRAGNRVVADALRAWFTEHRPSR
jgi:lysophospholipase L1-like esterase